MPLPESFPLGTTFWDCNDLPVSVPPRGELGTVCTAWDVEGGRRFPCTTVDSDGVPISEAAFRALVARELGRDRTP
jgi:hypothetical protein